MTRIPCPSEAWDRYIRDCDTTADAEERGVEVVTFCPRCGAKMDDSVGCPDCYARELAREAELALQLKRHPFPVPSTRKDGWP